jgi:hypothetical protein
MVPQQPKKIFVPLELDYTPIYVKKNKKYLPSSSFNTIILYIPLYFLYSYSALNFAWFAIVLKKIFFFSKKKNFDLINIFHIEQRSFPVTSFFFLLHLVQVPPHIIGIIGSPTLRRVMVGKNKYLVGTKSWREEGFYGYYGTQSSVQCVEVTTFHMSSHLEKNSTRTHYTVCNNDWGSTHVHFDKTR